MTTATQNTAASISDRDAAVTKRRHLRERRDVESRHLLEQRVLAEFREMPCLRLTPAQAERLFGLRHDISNRVIAQLIATGRVRVDDEGRFALAEVE